MPSPLSGLLRCGVCNSRMVLDIGTRGHRNFQGAAHKTRSSAICPNAKRVSEHKVLSAFIETVKQSLAHPQFRERFDATFKRLFAEAVRPNTGESEAERRLRAQEAKVAKLAPAVDDYADIESLVSRLRAEEATLRDLRRGRLPPPRPTGGAALPHSRPAFDPVGRRRGHATGQPAGGTGGARGTVRPGGAHPTRGGVDDGDGDARRGGGRPERTRPGHSCERSGRDVA